MCTEKSFLAQFLEILGEPNFMEVCLMKALQRRQHQGSRGFAALHRNKDRNLHRKSEFSQQHMKIIFLNYLIIQHKE